MKILIIENVSMGKDKYGFFDKTLLTSFSILPTLQARQIKAVTPEKYDVHVLNERYEKIDFEKKYDLIDINFSTSTAPRAYEIADKFRNKDVTVVLSGYHPSALPKEAKKHADSVIIGNSELIWPELLQDFEKNNLKDYYKPSKIIKKTRIPPTNIGLSGFVMTGAVEATRGCPYNCNFCPEGNMPGNNVYHQRSINEVIDEIRNIPQKTIMFYDNSLTINPDYTKKLFHEMKKLNKKFFCNGNANVLAEDKELVRLSKKAGCVSWLIGFESVNQKTLDEIDKKTNKVDQYKKAVENIHRNNMAVIGDFIFGFDTDDKSVFDETLKIIKNLKIDVADFCILTPFPGTPIYNKLKKENRLLTDNWGGYHLRNVVFQPKNMSPDELKKGVIKLYQEFYSPSYTIRRITHGFKLGFYPFFMILARNAVALMASRRLK